MSALESARGTRILITDGYCKQSLPFIRGFKVLGCHVTVLCGSKLDCAYVSRLPDRKVLGICNPGKPDETIEYVTSLIKTGDYDIVFPLFDFTVRDLSHRKKELSQYATIYVNDPVIFDRAYDKGEVMRVCAENGIPCPTTVQNVKSLTDLSSRSLQFPTIAKPRRMYGARGFHVFQTMDELRAYVASKGIDVCDYVFQELIPPGSYVMGANVFVDRNGDIKSSYLYKCEHIYPESGGTSTLNGFLIRDDIKEYCERLVKTMNLRGEVGVDLMLDARDNLGKVIEINVRPVHGIAMGFFFGVNHAQQVLEDALGLPVTPMEINRVDTAVRILQTDALWFLSSRDRFRRAPRKLGYKHVKEQMFFWDDPLPWFAFLIDGVKNYRKKMLEKTQ